MVYAVLYLGAGYLVNRQVWPLSFAENGLLGKALGVLLWPAKLAWYAINAA